MNINIPQGVLAALNKLTFAGFEAYVVGGCVRDSLMGVQPNDWDICTSALPEEVISCFEGYRVIKTGVNHGTVTVLMSDHSDSPLSPISQEHHSSSFNRAIAVEITTYRIDGDYSDHRRPDTICFTSSLTDDLSRRDFTINAMAYHPDFGLCDPFGGALDISRKCLCCVGEPDKRFKEDALRIMRLLRFCSVTGFSIDEKTSSAAIKNSPLLQKISVERVFTELKKLLCGNNCLKAMDDGREILSVFIPEITPMFGFEQHNPHHIYDVWKHTLFSIENIEDDVLLRLTMLFHDIGKPHTFSRDKRGTGHFYGHSKKSAEMASAILKRLHSDNQTILTTDILIRHHCMQLAANEVSVKKWLRQLGEKHLRMLVKVKRADTVAKGVKSEIHRRLSCLDKYSSLIDDVIASGTCLSLKDLAINGGDLIDFGITDGKSIGKLLDEALSGVVNGAVKNEKDILLSYLSDLYNL